MPGVNDGYGRQTTTHTLVQLVQKLPRILSLSQVEIQKHHHMPDTSPAKVNATF